ncbi:hypothetical protein [Capnocytophaga sp.]|uniref:hypothetical protein n=1 Tax=Capnocytophaga sp. TaxID=44737 RepID=UPI0026DAF443|nr:hypothetical protein [Capnocytophaga sp.]MDO5104720.1 hypothetical protein [Capnocytophaga sp.]
MKQLTQLLKFYLLIAMFISCNKQVDETNFSITMRENFTDVTKNKSNIQVNDYVPYEVIISDTEDNNEIEYRLVPVRKGNNFHQILWKDYGLYLSDTDSITKNKPNYVSFSGKGKHNLYIRPLVAGTFKHVYELQKWKNEQQIGNSIKINENFNAIKISAYYDDSFFSFARGWFLKVDDGQEETDKYLTEQSATYKYTLNIITKDKIRMIREGFPDFFGNIRFLAPNDLFDNDKPEHIQKVKVTKKVKDMPKFEIVYYDIKIEK